MTIGLSQLGEGYILGSGVHLTPITVTSAFAQFVIPTGKKTAEFFNIGTQTAYYGTSGVTTAVGFPLVSTDQKHWVNVVSGWNVYVCCGSGLTTEIRVVVYD